MVDLRGGVYVSLSGAGWYLYSVLRKDMAPDLICRESSSSRGTPMSVPVAKVARRVYRKPMKRKPSPDATNAGTTTSYADAMTTMVQVRAPRGAARRRGDA